VKKVAKGVDIRLRIQETGDRRKKAKSVLWRESGVFEKRFGQDYRIYEDIVNHEFTQPALSLPNGNLHERSKALWTGACN